MSDFDEEAERKRLRKQYEQEQAEREATEKMSELLLQGATMTNAHCSDCGDPIFRYDGQEFCATCEKAIDREAESGDTGESGDGIEVATPDEETRVSFGGGADDETGSTGLRDAKGEASTATDDTSDETDHSGQAPDQPNRSPSLSIGEDSGALPETRATLERTLVSLTAEAEAADDPRDAEAYLDAARAAAETLAALRG